MDNNIIYSLIIPHHNTPNLLERCLNSIPSRNDLQIIIVDDNSNDEIVDFDKFPGSERQDVCCIFDKEGKGAGHARNLGLKYAQGEWLLFADADDMYTPAMTDLLDRYKLEKSIDIVFFDVEKIDDNNNRSSIPLNRYISNYVKGKGDSLEVLKYRYYSPWSRMFRRKLQVDNNLFFEELPFSNDMMFVLNMTKQAKSFDVFNDVIYLYYLPKNGSITKKRYEDKKYNYLRATKPFKLKKFCDSISYPYSPPIWISVKGVDKNVLQKVYEENSYSLSSDLMQTLKYFWAKVRRVL